MERGLPVCALWVENYQARGDYPRSDGWRGEFARLLNQLAGSPSAATRPAGPGEASPT